MTRFMLCSTSRKVSPRAFSSRMRCSICSTSTRVDAGGRLVEQHEPRVAHQHRRELEQLLLPVRELARTARSASRGEPELVQQLERARALAPADARAGAPRATAAGAQRPCSATSVRSGKTRACWNVRVRPRRARRTGSGLRTRRAGEADRPGVGPQVAGDQVEDGRLAGAVRADQRRSPSPPAPTNEQSSTASTPPKRFVSAVDLEQPRSCVRLFSYDGLAACVRRRSRSRATALARATAGSRAAGAGARPGRRAA